MKKSPNTRRNVTPQVLADPVGIDTIVTELQVEFTNKLSWLEKSFNRAVLRSKTNTEGNEKLFPACWIGAGKDEYNMLENDNWDAYSFFYASGDDLAIDYNENTDTTFERDLALYFWFKPAAIDATKGQGEVIELVKREVVSTIKNYYFIDGLYGVDIASITDIPSEVFSGFTLDVTTTQSLYHPYAAIRIDLNAIYTYDLGC
jgi:hypothetical protein